MNRQFFCETEEASNPNWRKAKFKVQDTLATTGWSKKVDFRAFDDKQSELNESVLKSQVESALPGKQTLKTV